MSVEVKRVGFVRKLLIILEMIKFEHTLFALPFALASALVAARGLPKLAILIWILAAMVGARSAAMAFNRIADARIDALIRERRAGRCRKGLFRRARHGCLHWLRRRCSFLRHIC